MCLYKKLHHTEYGYVVRCNECHHFHVGFGTTVLALTEDQFYDFMNTVDSYHDAHRHYYNADQKVIQIPTAARSIMLVFSLKEIEQLSTLLHTVSKKLDREKFFQFYKN